MKRIFASLFVVGALVSMGVFASTAYFQTSASQTGFILKTGTASLTIYPDQDGSTLLDSGSPITVGPGFDEYQCFLVKNTGNYPLNVTLTLAFTAGNPAVESALDLSINPNPTACSGYGTDYLLSAYSASPQPLDGTLAVGAQTNVVMRLHWDATADQSLQDLQGLSPALTISGTIIGTTPHS